MNFENFTIRSISIEDAQNYFQFVNSNKERIEKYFSNVVTANNDIASTMSFITERLALFEKAELLSFIVYDNLTKQIIGSIFVKNFDRNVQKCELSFFIDQNYEGKGITTKAIALMTNHCFLHLGINKVFLRIADDNISSKRVAEKNGFVVEGTLRQDFKTPDGQLIDIVYYGLLNVLPRAF
jgi:ribosomal-protein-serine acetyltransferase